MVKYMYGERYFDDKLDRMPEELVAEMKKHPFNKDQVKEMLAADTSNLQAWRDWNAKNKARKSK